MMKVFPLKTLLFTLFFFIFTVPAYGAAFEYGEDYTFPKNASTTEDLYVLGANTTIAGDVGGDLLGAGYSVYLGGDTVSGDVFLIGESVHVLAEVQKTLRSFSRRIILSSSVTNDVALASWNVEILPKTVIGGDLLVAAGNIDFQGSVAGDAYIAGGDVYINGEINGDANIFANKITIGPLGIIRGSLQYSASEPAAVLSGGQILGSSEYTQINTRTRAEQFLPTLWGTLAIVQFAIFLLSALVAHGILRKVSSRFVIVSLTEMPMSLLRGFLLVLAVPVATIVASLTFIAIPFSLFALVLFGIGLLLSLVYAPIIIGSLVYRLTHQDEDIVVSWKTILLGVCAATAFGYIPYVGGVLWYGFVLVALGGIYQVLADKFIEVR